MARNSWWLILAPFFLVACTSTTSEESPSTEKAPSLAVNPNQHLITEPPVVVNRDFPVRYEVKDGHIRYRYSGLQEGYEDVYFTQYGMVEIKFTKTKRPNPFKKADEFIDLTTLMRDSAIYVVDNLTKNARRLDNVLLYETALQSPSLDLNEVAEDMFRARGGSIVDTQTIAGVPAEKWVIKEANSQEWRWKGILMKTIVELPRNMVKVEAIEIDTVSPLPEGIFDLPTDVNVQEGTSMKQWMEDLSKPIERKQYFDLQGNPISRDSFRRIK